MSDLPKQRLPFNEQPFTHTGIDYFGPINVKLTQNRRSNQVSFCLLTCLIRRAFHLELASDLSTDILTLRRFIVFRVKPEQIL